VINEPEKKHMIGPVARLRGAFERVGLRILLATGFIRTRLAASRATPVDGRILDPEVAAILRLAELMNRSNLIAADLAIARRNLLTSVIAANLPPPVVHSEDRTIPSDAGTLGARLYVPPGLATHSAGIVYFHGGGWVTGSVESHDVFCRRLAHAARCRVVSVDYRLAPEHPFPAAVDDAVAAARFVLAHAEKFGMDPARIAVAGDSAGGNLSAIIALATRHDARRPRLQVLIYPAVDLSCSTKSYDTFADGYLLTRRVVDWYLRLYVENADVRDPRISPQFSPQVSDVPALVYTAGFDVLRDEAQIYARRLQAAGTRVTHREFPGFIHGFVLMTVVRSALAATNVIAADIRRELEA
jgi:acetyl esterase